MTLAYSGCRLSEALALTVVRIDLGVGTVVFESLEKRRDGVYRAPRVIGDALLLPKAEQIAAHPERLKRIAPQIWTESGDDPRWVRIPVDREH